MTAIAVSYTTDGFALLADGRARRDDGFIVSEKAQKIFPVEGNSHLAYILAGNLVLGVAGTTQVLFDFSTVIKEAVSRQQSAVSDAEAISSQPSAVSRTESIPSEDRAERDESQQPARTFAEAVCEYVLDRYGEAQAVRPFSLHGEVDPTDRTRTIARIFLVGYWCDEDPSRGPRPSARGRRPGHQEAAGGKRCACLPAWINARFFDQGDDALRYALDAIDVKNPLSSPMMYGSEIVAGLFANHDPRVEKYRVTAFSPPPARRDPAHEAGPTGNIARLPDEDQLLGSTLATVLRTGGRPRGNSRPLSLGAGYIAACCDPEIARLDPERCAGIGGAMQMATITPEQGFVWRQKN
ncbi:MAG: hypothetical protein ABSD20_11860 [Terriglobales bacterium]